jgi:HEAT repeat protein
VRFFYELRKEDLSQQYIKALIDLFKMEDEKYKIFNDFFEKGGTADKLPNDIAYINSEAYGMYHTYLCRLISKSNDRSLLNLVLKSCWDPKALVNFGNDAVDPVINVLKSSRSSVGKIVAMEVLGEMLTPKETGYVASGDTRSRIKDILIQTTKDSDQYVRSSAIKALGQSEDKDIIPLLEDIAKNDPYCFEEKDPSGKKVTRCPVRSDAQKVIEQIKGKRPGRK